MHYRSLSLLFFLLLGTLCLPSIGMGLSPDRKHASHGPNYAARMDRRVSWKSFPLRVYFVQDDNYSERREQAALRGFDRWVEATEGFVEFEVTEESSQANITVRFDPATNNGLTSTVFREGRIRKANIAVGVKQTSTNDLECIAAHEFGHALGLSGHSDDDHDLMYPVHWSGAPGHITERDLNTLAVVYPALGKRLAE